MAFEWVAAAASPETWAINALARALVDADGAWLTTEIDGVIYGLVSPETEYWAASDAAPETWDGVAGGGETWAASDAAPETWEVQ